MRNYALDEWQRQLLGQRMQRDAVRIAEGERLHGEHFETFRQAKDETLDWLLWYNQTQLHSTLNYVSPTQFEQDWNRSTAAIAS